MPTITTRLHSAHARSIGLESTSQDEARMQLDIARHAVAYMLRAGGMDPVRYRSAHRSARLAILQLAQVTNVSYPNYGAMSLAARDALRAVAELEVGLKAVRHIDNGRAQAVQLESLRNARRLLRSASRRAMAGTHY